MSKKAKHYKPAAAAAPLDAPTPPTWEAAWKQIGGVREIPKPAAVELAPRELHFMMIHIVSLMSNPKSKEDAKGMDVMSGLYQKLFVVQRQWFDDIEAAQTAPKVMEVAFKGAVEQLKP